MRDTGRTTASLMVETSLVACRPPFGTVLFLQPATCRLPPQHPHSPCLPRSPPGTVAAHLVQPPPGDLARTMAPGQIHPNAACRLLPHNGHVIDQQPDGNQLPVNEDTMLGR